MIFYKKKSICLCLFFILSLLMSSCSNRQLYKHNMFNPSKNIKEENVENKNSLLDMNNSKKNESFNVSEILKINHKKNKENNLI
ncbi:Putative outer membrane protein assembly factor BamC [Buchnera aphidicola (Tetraneura ulmi)]|uniref:hypothetical protein n=1 Tax=Buchnera aphidicola TaxID=9 RepID=UPI003463D67E